MTPRTLEYGMVLLAYLFSATGCSRKIADLGSDLQPSVPEGGNGTGAPVLPPFFSEEAVGSAQHLVSHDGTMWAFAEHSGRLFWVTGHRSAGKRATDFPDQFFLRTCSTPACGQSLQSIPLAPPENGMSWVWANDSRVFWPNATGVSFCSHDDCSSIGHLPFVVASEMGFAADETRAFFDGAGICDIDDCVNTHTALQPAVPQGQPQLGTGSATVLDGDYLYEIAGGHIVRFRKDGTDSVQIIARNQPDAHRIALQSEYIYWTETLPLGRLLRCPVAGCTDAPEVVASSLYYPSDLTVDDKYVYFAEPEGADVNPVLRSSPTSNPPLTKRISRCPVAGCVTPERLIQNQWAVSAPFVDGRFIYFSGADCSSDCAGYIGAVAK